jgi:hypothetical protein
MVDKRQIGDRLVTERITGQGKDNFPSESETKQHLVAEPGLRRPCDDDGGVRVVRGEVGEGACLGSCQKVGSPVSLG